MTPKPWTQHELRTIFLRVPPTDWLLVKHGRKREFRTSESRYKLDWVHCPTPVVAYTTLGRRQDQHDSALMVAERIWREPLGAISEESVLYEGYDSFADFRRYYRNRTKRPFKPLQEVWCFRVRPWTPKDLEELGVTLLTRLYGEHLPS